MKKILKSLPPIRWLLDIRRELALIRFQASNQTRIQQQIFRELITQRSEVLGKSFPATHEHQTFSQNGEDGIIQEILRRLGKGSEYFLWKLAQEMGWKTIPECFLNSDGRDCGWMEQKKTVLMPNVKMLHS